MFLYNEELINDDLNKLKEWVANKEWSDIKRELYLILKKKYNNKYLKNDNSDNINSTIFRLGSVLDEKKLLKVIKKINTVQNGGYNPYYNPYYNQMQGGINFGKIGSMMQSRASSLANKARTQIAQQGKQMAQQAKEYAQQQVQQAQNQAEQYLQQQAINAQQYAQQQAQQFQQKFDNKLGQVEQNFRQRVSNLTDLPSSQEFISYPHNTSLPMATGPGNIPVQIQGYGQPIPNLPTLNFQAGSTGMIESFFDFCANIGQKIIGL